MVRKNILPSSSSLSIYLEINKVINYIYKVFNVVVSGSVTNIWLMRLKWTYRNLLSSVWCGVQNKILEYIWLLDFQLSHPGMGYEGI